MEIARAKQIRIWKDFKASAKQNEKGKSDTYNAKVIEVHSGDSLSVMNLVNNEIKRIFLANIRAPSLGNAKKGEPEKPGALEAKDFLRKLLVGKQVKVEMEFVKTLQQKPLVGGEPNEKHDAPKSLEFATLFLGDKNVSESLLAAGLANVAMPRVDEEFTK